MTTSSDRADRTRGPIALVERWFNEKANSRTGSLARDSPSVLIGLCVGPAGPALTATLVALVRDVTGEGVIVMVGSTTSVSPSRHDLVDSAAALYQWPVEGGRRPIG